MNYYNEFDKNAAAWLRELIKLGVIPDGEVDERSIEDVRAEDLKGFMQCHFFAGIAGWPEALRRAGVPATRPLWTGSCPCQDFSCAGKQKGFEGSRDLWPAFHDLIRECHPELVFGEQVKNAVRHGWLDRLYADLEGEGYACGSVVLGAHSAGADHIRQRIYWVANAEHKQREGGVYGRREESPQNGEWGAGELAGSCPVSRMADAERDGWNERRAEREGLGGSAAPVGRSAVGGHGAGACGVADDEIKQRDGIGHREISEQTESANFCGVGGLADSIGDQEHKELGRPEGDEGKRGSIVSGGCGLVSGMGDTSPIGPEMRDGVHRELRGQGSGEGRATRWLADTLGERGCGGQSGREDASDAGQSGQARNFWSDARPHLCKDGKWRRFEPRIFPLVAKSARSVGHSGDPREPEYADQTSEARVMRLKGYGNCICVDTAVLFIEACEDVLK